jgi:SUKH superfamily protein
VIARVSLLQLKQLITPPPRPLEAGSLAEWSAVEQKLGLSLPVEYRDFILTYGTGQFANFYLIYNPFSVSEWVNLHACVERVCKMEREFKREWPEMVPYKIFPDGPGLLPWGSDDNGNYYYWLTEGPADSWQVVSNESRGEGFREYGRCMTDFLCGILTGEIEALAGDYPESKDRMFKPIDVTKEMDS